MWSLLFAITTAAAERPPEVGLTIEPLVSVDLEHETDTEDTFESWTWIHAKAKQRLPNGEWFFATRASHTVRHGLDTESIWRLEVGETGIAGTVGPVYARAGNLVERWGKLDVTPIVDVLNPRDLSAGPLSTIEALRLPTPMVSMQASMGRSRMELTYSPFPQPDRIHMIGSDWSPIRQGMLEATLSESASWEGDSAALLSGQIEQLGDLLDGLQPSTLRALSSTSTSIERREQTGLNGNAGVRLELEAPGLDAALMGATLVSAIPQTELNPSFGTILQTEELPDLNSAGSLLESNPLAVTWPRTWMAGAEASTVVGPIGVRAEAAWWSNRVIQEPWLSSTTSPVTAVGGGLDWAHGSTLFASVEARWTHIVEPPPITTVLAPDTVDLGATARMSFANDRINVMAATLWTPTFEEWMARPEIQWRVSDPVQLSVGAVLIHAADPPPVSLSDALRYTGGPLTMASDNDVVFAALRWIK